MLRTLDNACCLLTNLAVLLTIGTLATGCELMVNDRKNDKVGDPAIYAKNKPVGTSSRALLADELFQSVIVEVQYVEGFAPPQEALNKFQAFLEKHLNKRKIEIRQSVAIPSPGLERYGVSDIRALEAHYRHEETLKNQIALYFLFVDKPSRDDQVGGERMLGQAYQNTSIVVYESTLRELLAAAEFKPSMGLFEATVMAHELGHVLGLVGDGIAPVQAEHMDAAHPHHCVTPTCLMNYTAESVSVLTALGGNTIPELDSFCLQDLKSGGGK